MDTRPARNGISIIAEAMDLVDKTRKSTRRNLLASKTAEQRMSRTAKGSTTMFDFSGRNKLALNGLQRF